MCSSVIFFSIVFVIFMCIANTSPENSNWCGLESCQGKRHIDCDNADALAAGSCPLGTVALNLAEVSEKIVAKHNEYRNKLAGGDIKNLAPAARMATMRWSSTLAKLAEKNILRCKFERDECRNTPKYDFVGQNTGLFSYTKGMKYKHISMINTIIDFWWNEHKSCTMEHIISFPNSMEKKIVISHFTQMVNEQATKIGCACAAIRLQRSTNFHFVCNYSFDNMKSFQVYEPGPPASGCKSGPNDEYTNLCSINEEYTLIVSAVDDRMSDN